MISNQKKTVLQTELEDQLENRSNPPDPQMDVTKSSYCPPEIPKQITRIAADVRIRAQGKNNMRGL